jgi:lysophospholipase L1-like esterase
VTDPASPASASSDAVYYLSLGDSLAQGVQPVSSGAQHTTDQGYVDDLYAHYHAETKFSSSLTSVKLGCSGATTTSMINGTDSLCKYQQGSQLNGALAFIKAHKSKIALITIDIGADDIVPCFEDSNISSSCMKKGLAEVSSDLPKILSALRKAAGPKTVISSMSLYDPWLAYYLLGSQGKAVAEQSLSYMETFNSLLAADFKPYDVKKADVWGTFDSADYTQSAATATNGTQPLDVARICQWTWMCSAQPIGQNVHANATGYKQIAAAYEKIIGTLS